MSYLSRKLYRRWMFVLGVIATVAYRIIVVLNHYSPVWVQIAWYVGTVGFVWYFSHRFRVENRRDKLVTELGLVNKIKNNEPLSEKDRQALASVLNGLQTSLSKWNYVAIFALSVLALAYGVYQDFLMVFLF
ncbi:TPA: hypothetical protein DCZ15_03585 [Candidatus Falkowbacteria bacterium]|jgi:hypothetical protein|nr:MAG: hypothetical protein UV95_C0005G0004 [Candidatus Falkowbacteria bacterium GW2011_GWF2_43_32]HBA36928.1 hypothetical protein [Candidatus Falkowbacteria bacterium]